MQSADHYTKTAHALVRYLHGHVSFSFVTWILCSRRMQARPAWRVEISIYQNRFNIGHRQWAHTWLVFLISMPMKALTSPESGNQVFKWGGDFYSEYQASSRTFICTLANELQQFSVIIAQKWIWKLLTCNGSFHSLSVSMSWSWSPDVNELLIQIA